MAVFSINDIFKQSMPGWVRYGTFFCIEAADKVYRLWNSDFRNIDVKTIGWSEGLLI